MWRREAPAESFEKTHSAGSLATSTPAVDADYVIAYFGSVGLLCFSHDGELIWTFELPVARTNQGSGTSPVVAGDRIVLLRDEAKTHYAAALDRRSGELLWRQDLPESKSPGPQESYSTPVLAGDKVILHRRSEVVALSLKEGRRIWWAALPTTGASTPVVTEDSIYVAAYSPLARLR